ncbi:MAG: DUF1566 domain-containing protein [Paraglaciecola sp.]|uniref:Lcl C-terminal domain-containing protein n=1 Tax=Paraglaciecola sp. TaxID=1920173 RepID=UPI003263D1A0
MSILFKSCVFIKVLLVSGLALSQVEQSVQIDQDIRTSIYSDSWSESRFELGNDDTVTDLVTDLMWKQCPEGTNLRDNFCEGEQVFVDWAEAHNMALLAAYAGYTDWRVPNIKELASLAALGRIPAVNINAFPLSVFDSLPSEAEAPNYLSSTRLSYSDPNANISMNTLKSVFYYTSSRGEVRRMDISSDPSDFKVQLLLVRDK